MSILDRFTAPATAADTLDHVAEAATIDAELVGADLTIEHLRESLADLELMLEDRGWMRMDAWADQQFSRQGLEQAARLCRVMAIANPLIRRGLNLRTAYVWGGGVTIQARAKGGNDGEQDVNAVIQGFLDDLEVRKHLTGSAARETNERTLGTDGNLIVALFTAPSTGRVRPRLIPLEEITEVIKNPEDRSEPWLYKRVSQDGQGRTQTTYHPDVDYQPRVRPTTFRSTATFAAVQLEPGEVLWDAPILHVKVNALPDWDFGIGDAFAAIAWARAYKEFLEDWAKLVKALSRFAWKVTSGRKGAAQAAVDKIRASQSDPSSTSVRDTTGQAGATIGMVGANLEAIPKTGATIDADSGRPLAGLVAAAMDVPVTMLLADPGVTGARATAETLDTPTELMAGLRRSLHGDFLRRLLDYVVDAAVRAPQGALQGTVGRDEFGRPVVTLDGDTERTIEIDWPDLTDTPIDLVMKAIAAADATEKLPPLVIVKLILAAFHVSDADEIIAELTDEDGNYRDPNVQAAATAAAAAAEAVRRGEDAAGYL